jgi:hypothetical protein
MAIFDSSVFLARAKPCVSEDLSDFAEGAIAERLARSLVRRASTSSSILSSSILYPPHILIYKVHNERNNLNSPFVFQLKLQFQTLHLNTSLSIMFQDSCVRFPMLRRCSIPSAGPVRRCLEMTKGGEVADYVAVCSTRKTVRLGISYVSIITLTFLVGSLSRYRCTWLQDGQS